MLFSSLTFLYYFLPAVILLYFLAPARLRSYVLPAASLFFYVWGENKYILLLLLSTLTAYGSALLIALCHKKNRSVPAKVILALFLTFSLFLLGFFKYTDFFIGNINSLLRTQIPYLRLALPLGISFYTFQTMSYVIDVYKKVPGIAPQRNFFFLLTYISMFPQLVAGPIVTYSTVADDLIHRKTTAALSLSGSRRFIMGLAKKVILANQLGELTVLLQNTGFPCTLSYWLLAIAFTLQIYFDFSGYSDMAIGLGYLFGFHFPENFNYPYISRSITEFWRRWHISLGTWFRNYLYIPLGGNRVSAAKWIRNIFIVWLCTGFWHGASWNFIFWGLYFALFLVLEKFFLQSWLNRLPRPVSHCYVLFFVVISFVLFYYDRLPDLGNALQGMFGLASAAPVHSETLYYGKSYLGLLIFSGLASTPVFRRLGERLAQKQYALFLTVPLYLCLLLLTTAYLVDSTFNPFLYFRF